MKIFDRIMSSRFGLFLAFLMLLAASTTILFSILSLGWFAPMHKIESFLCASMITAPLVAFVCWRMDKNRYFWNKHKKVFIGFVIFCMLMLNGIVYAVNVVADRSAATPVVTKVIDTDGVGCGPSRYRCITIELPDNFPLQFVHLTDTESFRLIWRNNNQKITPGQTRITLFIHQGFLGLPWHEDSNFFFSDKGPSFPAAAPNAARRQWLESTAFYQSAKVHKKTIGLCMMVMGDAAFIGLGIFYIVSMYRGKTISSRWGTYRGLSGYVTGAIFLLFGILIFPLMIFASFVLPPAQPLPY